ncbi:hypothetical protein B0T25DRAFT_529310 [Lasiosphaeria hispida]|uniref:Uncharacterized protein n=1 Tax=Lasiosphaeria hispida TaxID=260671 RepID=A0AAJ0HWC2_9PEZI|nr:hypothetical protein B0T25DRAFT_529310 [Lasiosphaeria hispida]
MILLYVKHLIISLTCSPHASGNVNGHIACQLQVFFPSSLLWPEHYILKLNTHGETRPLLEVWVTHRARGVLGRLEPDGCFSWSSGIAPPKLKVDRSKTVMGNVGDEHKVHSTSFMIYGRVSEPPFHCLASRTLILGIGHLKYDGGEMVAGWAGHGWDEAIVGLLNRCAWVDRGCAG